ncbi:thiamine phosphate synthase [Actinomycetospora cinnamomea]|uniref:Thiamine-phosphate synthase n=1 Tax=Actinomycetospora cinnamomea TaxID=663609 RepID=A0A2U1FM98_9PSEU|nr:thiamine phosphate synthase [Actinomycetospora cinnamomea]PVZ13170.1 thiamine-phosphate pyrophosphorylase [Actinomycetospora cinnamomea]
MTPVDPRLYLIVDPVHGPGDPLAVACDAVAGGVTAVQVRAPAATGRELYDGTCAVLAALRGSGVAVVVDDRLDVALAAGADGVHLGRHDVPPAEARRVAGPELSIGWSVTGPDDLDVPSGAVDLLGIGPVFATATKPDAAPATGVDGLRRLWNAARARGVPAVAIGGIDPDNAGEVLATGVPGLCVSSAIAAAPDPGAAARALRTVVDGA